ncbi:MAG TPA: esterase [Prolixibacteraceae bacterium]|nr:esterase [Prolixibacteraceae bacterium]
MFQKIDVNTPIEQINQFAQNTLVEALGIRFTEIAEGMVKATMPVDHRTHRPGGILHGGASLALAETVAGLGSMLMVDMQGSDVKGIQVSANHTGSISRGQVFATAKIIHKGSQTHVWDVTIESESGQLISIQRVTNMIVERNDRK